jgi:hypothetical protein
MFIVLYAEIEKNKAGDEKCIVNSVETNWMMAICFAANAGGL